jgi:predicted Zn-dependent peptidase
VARGARATGASATDAEPARVSAEHRITTLEDGVRVVTERVPGVRSVALGFWIATGSVAEHDDQAGISHLLEHMLFRGTERYGSQEIDQIFDAMGAEINAGTDKEATSLYTRVLDRHLERAFDVMSDMVWRPRFGELEAEREVVLEEIAMYEDDPQDRVFDLLGKAIFGSHPLGRAVIGSAEVVGSTTREQLGAFHAQRYLPPSVVIAAAGSVDHDALVEMAKRGARRADELACLPVPQRVRPQGCAPRGAPASAAERATGSANGHSSPDAAAEMAASALALAPDFRPRALFLQKDTEQYHVCLGGAGIARDDERRFALRVLEGVLGGTSSSRLFQEVRERRGLAYSVFCFSSLYAHTGEVGLYVGTRPDKLAAALAVVIAELERCVEDPASEEELVRSRENLKGRVVLGMESTGARMSRLGASVLNELPILSINEMIERIDAVDIDQVRALAAELFDPRRLSGAGVGPAEEQFQAAIEPLGAGADAAGAR